MLWGVCARVVVVTARLGVHRRPCRADATTTRRAGIIARDGDDDIAREGAGERGATE